MSNRIAKIVAVLERATIPSLSKDVHDIRDIKASEDDVIAALYLAAKLAYAREPGKDDTLSEITNILLDYGVIRPEKFLAYLDNQSLIVLQCTLPPNNIDHQRGYRRIAKILKMAAWASQQPKPDEKTPTLLYNLFSAVARLYRLDSLKLAEMIVNMFVATLPKLKREKDTVGGPDGNDSDDKFALFLSDFRIPPVVKSLLDALPREIVQNELEKALKNAKGRDAVNLAYVLLRSERFDLAHVLRLLGSDPAAMKAAWRKYSEKAEELAESASDIRSAYEIKDRDGPKSDDSWAVDASDRDVFVLEQFLDRGPWHAQVIPELELLTMAIRSGNWSLAKKIFKILEGNDVAAHPPVAKSLINLAFAMMQCVVETSDSNRLKEAKRRGDALTRLGFGFAMPLLKREDLFNMNGTIFEMLSQLGPHARRSLPFLSMLCDQLLGEDLKTNVGAYRLTELVILPAMTLCTSNAAIANKVWSFLSKSDAGTRWKLYKTLHESAPKKHAAVAILSSRAEWETRRVMKRVTTSSFVEFRRTMGKILHCQALSVSDAFLRRIQGYPPDRKTLTPYLETLILGTPLSFDIIASQIVEKLDSPRPRVKTDGYNFENWFASTSLLAGIFLRMIARESSTVEGVLEYLRRKICDEEEADYVSVLKDIILCTTEIDVARSLTTRQQQARSGGKHIRTVVTGKLDGATVTSVPGKILDRDEDKRCRNASICLKKALLRTGTNFHLGVGIAKFASKASSDSLSKKINSVIRDRVRGALHQFSETLQYLNNLEEKKGRAHDSKENSTVSKNDESGTKDAEMPNKSDDKTKAEKEKDDTSKTEMKETKKEEDVEMKDDGEQKPSQAETKVKDEPLMLVKSNSAEQEDDVWVRYKVTTFKELKELGIVPYYWFALLRPVLAYPDGLIVVKDWANEVETLYKAELARTFWTLDLADLDVPRKLYADESKRMSALVKRWKEAYHNYKKLEQKATTNKVYKEYAETRRCIDYEWRKFENLEKLLKTELENVQRRMVTVSNLLQEGGKAFGEGILNLSASERQTLILQFAENCFIPRALSSEADAIFCVKFVFGLNAVNDEALDLPDLIKYVISKASEILSSSTETDASNFGVAVRELLIMMDSWRCNKRAFDSNPNHGFRGKDGSLWRHEVYCNWAFEQHATLTSGLSKLLESSEYLHARNALALLHIVAGTFPKVQDHGTTLTAAVQKLTVSEKEDLKLTAVRVVGALNISEKTRVPVHMFKLKTKKEGEQNRGTKRERSPDAKLEYTKSPKHKDDKRPTDKGMPAVDPNPKRARTPDGEVDGSNAKRGRHVKERITDRLGGKVTRGDNRMRGGDDRRRRSDDGNWDNQRGQARGRDRDERNRDGEGRNNEPHPSRREGGRPGQERRNSDASGRQRDGGDHRDRRNSSNRGGDGPGRQRDGEHLREHRTNNSRDDEGRRNNSNRGGDGLGRQREGEHPREHRANNNRDDEGRRNNSNRGGDGPGRQRDGEHQREHRANNNRDDEGHTRERRSNNNRELDNPDRPRDGNDPPHERRPNNNRGRGPDEHPRDMLNSGKTDEPAGRHRFDNRDGRRPRERDDRNFDGRRDGQGWEPRDNRRRHSDDGGRNRENDSWGNHQRYRQEPHHGPPMRNRNNRYGNRGPPHPMDGPPHQRRDSRHRRDDRFHQNERRDEGPQQFDDMRDGGNYGRPNRRRASGRSGNQGHRR